MRLSDRGPGLAAAIAAVLLAGATPGRAQEAPSSPEGEVVRLSTEEAVARALASNERTRIARADVDRTEGLVREAFSAALPSIDGTYRMTRNLQRPVLFFNQDGETQQISIGDENEHAFSISVEQPIFDRSLGAAVRAARHGRAAGVASYEQALSEVAFETRRAYYDALLEGARLRVRENALRLAGARLEQVELFYDVGTASEFDLLTARVAVENERPEVIRAGNAFRLARNALKRVTGMGLERPVELTDTLAYRPVTIGLEEATERALERRGDLEAMRRTVAVGEEMVEVQGSGAYPTLSLELDLSRRASSDEFVPPDRDFSQSASAALAVSIPIFDGRRTQGRALQARADLAEAIERARALAQDVRLEVLDAWQSVQAAAEAIEATRATVGQARRAHEIALVRFRGGLSTQLELDEAEQNVVQAESNAAEALYLHMLAAARLAQAMGER